MGKFFYSKLALSNLKRNRNAYVPYILACIGIIFTFFLFDAIGRNEGMKNVSGKDQLTVILDLGEVVVGIFSVIFILYANSFLMKRRKKEFGLYGILGLEKRHVSYVMFYETLFMGIFTIIIGLIFGAVFGKLVFLVLLRILNTADGSTFIVAGSAVLKTIVFFSIIFFVTLVFNYISVRLANPIALLKGEEFGEKEPKTKIISTLIGAGCLGYGYYMALTVNSAVDSLSQFFIAVLFVIAGTHFLFTAGSIVILKALKKNKSFYYKTNNFISISSMIYRMKQNAAGLATICILSTMVLVTASTTIALYAGEDEILNVMSPYDISMTIDNNNIKDDFDNQVKDIAKKNNVKIKESTEYQYFESDGMLKTTKYEKLKSHAYSTEVEKHSCTITYLTLSQFNKLTNQSYTLGNDEAIVLNPNFKYKQDTITIGNTTLSIKEKDIFDGLPTANKMVFHEMYLVVNDDNVDKIVAELKKLDPTYFTGKIEYRVNQDIIGSTDNRIAYANNLKDYISSLGSDSYTVQSKDQYRMDSYHIYGGLLFIGVFLSLLFLLATVLIIYFKQVSEGFSDRKRFVILRKVGMDDKSIKQTINKQIILVFFLPLVGAMIHICFAFRMICKMLSMLYLSNTQLFLAWTIGSCIVFSVIYVIVYLTTARTYYKVVNEND